MMNQLELIERFQVDDMNICDNLTIIEYIYNESQINSRSELGYNIDKHPLFLICRTLENSFKINLKTYIDINENQAVIELYSVNELDELTITRVTTRLYLLIEKLLFGKIISI